MDTSTSLVAHLPASCSPDDCMLLDHSSLTIRCDPSAFTSINRYIWTIDSLDLPNLPLLPAYLYAMMDFPPHHDLTTIQYRFQSSQLSRQGWQQQTRIWSKAIQPADIQPVLQAYPKSLIILASAEFMAQELHEAAEALHLSKQLPQWNHYYPTDLALTTLVNQQLGLIYLSPTYYHVEYSIGQLPAEEALIYYTAR